MNQDLSQFEIALHCRLAGEPAADLQSRVMSAVEAELSASNRAARSNGQWSFAAAMGVVLLLGLALSRVASSVTPLDFARHSELPQEATAQSIQRLAPDLSESDVARMAMVMQTRSEVLAMASPDSSTDFSPSSGTPGEGWGGGFIERRIRENPHPSPPPEYRGRE